MVRLFTTFYAEPRATRAREYACCLERNLSCPSFDEICVLVESGQESLPSSDKLRTRRVARRPSYDDFFEWIGEIAAGDDTSVIANADIWFDPAIAVAAGALVERECFALARWENDRLFDRNDSQDAWIVRGTIDDVNGDFPIGVPRCDNRLLYELEIAGYTVRNPAFSIRANHVHSGQRSEYAVQPSAGWVPGPYRYLWPHNLWPLHKTVLHNATMPSQRIGWKVDWRRVGRTLPARAAKRILRAARP